MNNIRKAYIEQNNTLSDVGIHTINIDVGKPISAIELVIKATNGSISNVGQKLIDAIQKIEVVDGSNIIYSLSGVQAVASAYHTQKLKPYIKQNEGASGQQIIILPILFGDFIGDSDHFINPAEYNNLQVKIQTNATISTTVGFTSGSFSASTIVNLITQGANPGNGFIMRKVNMDFTVSGSGEENANLPSDYDYLDIMVIARESGITPQEAITNVKLSINQDSFIPFDVLTADSILWDKAKKVPYSYDVELLLANDGTYKHDCWNDGILIPKSMGDGIIYSPTSIIADAMVFSLLDLSTPGTPGSAATTSLNFVGKGYNPFGSMNFKMGHLGSNKGFNVKPSDKIDLKMTQGNEGGVASVVISQIRR